MAQRLPEAAPPPGRSYGPVKGRVAVSRSAQRGHQGNYAAIDLGTNNCRLLIARPAREGFVVVDSFSRIVRLGEGLAASGRLSDPAMDRALSALAICADKLRRRNVGLVRSVATEACRRAVNGRAFVERVYDETGIALEIISTEQEARLAMTGCHALLEPGEGPALIFDIGGGSTELVIIDGRDPDGTPHIMDWVSVPWGVVSLTESEPIHHPDTAARLASYDMLRARVAEALAPFAQRLSPPENIRLLGTSGTVTTLGSVHLGLARYDRRMVDGMVAPTQAMRDISSRLAGLAVEDRAQISSIGAERADLVVAGCAILESIFDIWPAERLAVADRGIREGILRSLMARNGRLS